MLLGYVVTINSLYSKLLTSQFVTPKNEVLKNASLLALSKNELTH